jgi:hypothetical protein
MRKKSIEVEAMADMTRREVRLTNAVANIMINKHHMCIDCAIEMAVAFIKSQRSKHSHIRTSGPCSDACTEALREFFKETLGSEEQRVSIDDLPPTVQ